jgi:hypothetical protein
MRKVLLVAVVLTGLVLYAGSAGFAAEYNYTASATMPSSNGLVAYQVLNGVWATTSTTAFAFGTLKEVDVTDPATPNDKKFIFLPNATTDWYYVILPTGGGLASTASVTASFSDNTGALTGLGNKIAITYVSVGATETKVKCASLQESSSITVASLNGGGLRMYVGIYTGKKSDYVPWTGPAADVFSGADAAGAYGGTLKISVQ